MLRSLPSRVVLALALILILSLTACNGASTSSPIPPETPSMPPRVTVIQGTQAPEAPTATPASQPVGSGATSPGTITIAFIQDFDTLNPMYAQALSSIYTQQIWNCRAWNFDDQNNPVPVLIKELPSLQNNGISADGRVITLKLREDIFWTDGQPIQAQDFVFTYQMITNAANEVAAVAPYDGLESVTAPDAQTVVITFKQPFAAWMSALWHYLLPSHILQPVFASQGSLKSAEWNIAPTVSCGPYHFQSWESGVSATFTANDKYWLGKPRTAEVKVVFLADDNAKSQALQSGQADLSVFLTNASLYVPQLQQGGAKLLPVASGYNEGWFFFLDPTNGHPALQDVRVRQAIALGLDRQAMAQSLLGGLSSVVETYWDQSPYANPEITPWTRDTARANQLLDEAGWVDSNNSGTRDKDGTELILTYGTTTNEVRQAVQQMAQSQLAEIGIKLELYNYDSSIFFQGYNEGGPAATGQMDIFEYAPRTKNYPDPGTNDFLCSQVPSANELGENWSWLCNEEMDRLLQLQATQIDFQQRQTTLHQISKLIHDQVYFLGLWTDPDIWAATPRLSNVRLSGITPFYNIHEWGIAP